MNSPPNRQITTRLCDRNGRDFWHRVHKSAPGNNIASIRNSHCWKSHTLKLHGAGIVHLGAMNGFHHAIAIVLVERLGHTGRSAKIEKKLSHVGSGIHLLLRLASNLSTQVMHDIAFGKLMLKRAFLELAVGLNHKFAHALVTSLGHTRCLARPLTKPVPIDLLVRVDAKTLANAFNEETLAHGRRLAGFLALSNLLLEQNLPLVVGQRCLSALTSALRTTLTATVLTRRLVSNGLVGSLARRLRRKNGIGSHGNNRRWILDLRWLDLRFLRRLAGSVAGSSNSIHRLCLAGLVEFASQRQ